MLWLAPGLRSILTPPSPDAEVKASISSAKKNHAKVIHHRSALTSAVHARLSEEVSKGLVRAPSRNSPLNAGGVS